MNFFSFLQNTSVPLPLEPVDYLFLEPFFVSLDKSILPHRRYLLSKVSGILETFSELFPQLCVMYELVFSLLTWYILIGNIFLQSRLIWATSHIATDYQKFPLLVYYLKNVLQNTFQKCKSSRSLMLFKIGVLKLHAWRPAALLEKKPQHTCFPVNITKFLRTAFLWNTSDDFFRKWSNKSNSTLQIFVRERFV